MVWIDRVFSAAYQTANVAINATAKNAVDVSSVTSRLSTRLSVIRVPTTLIKTTANQ